MISRQRCWGGKYYIININFLLFFGHAKAHYQLKMGSQPTSWESLVERLADRWWLL